MDSFTKFLTIAANVGLLAGLVLVFFQMRQNEALLRVSLLNQHNESYISVDASVAGESLFEIWAKSFEDPANLTIGEMRAMEVQTYSPILRWRNLYRLYEAGLIDESVWKEEIQADAAFYFTSPYAKTWWDVIGNKLAPSVLPPEMKLIVNEVLSNVNSTPKDNYEEIGRRLRESQNDA